MEVSARRYTPDHVWLDPDGRVGVTRGFLEGIAAIDAIHLAASGARVETARSMGAIEAEKGAFELYAPCNGVILERNETLLSEPGALLLDPEATWLVQIEGNPGRLLSAEEYEARVLRLGPDAR